MEKTIDELLFEKLTLFFRNMRPDGPAGIGDMMAEGWIRRAWFSWGAFQASGTS